MFLLYSLLRQKAEIDGESIPGALFDSALFQKFCDLIKKTNKSDIEIFIDSLNAKQASSLLCHVKATPMAYFFAMQNDKKTVDFLLKKMNERVRDAIWGALSKNNNKLALYFFNNASLTEVEEVIVNWGDIFLYKEFLQIIGKHKTVLQLLAAKGEYLLADAIRYCNERKVNFYIDCGVPFTSAMINIIPDILLRDTPTPWEWVVEFLLKISNRDVREQLIESIPTRYYRYEEIKNLLKKSQLLEFIEKNSTQEYRLSVRNVKSYTPSLHAWLLQCSNKNLLPPEINLLITSFILGYSDKETAAFCKNYYETMPKRLLDTSLDASAKKYEMATSGKPWDKKIQGLFFQSPEKSTYLAECKEANERFSDRVSRKF